MKAVCVIPGPAGKEISMIKALVPTVHTNVCDRAMQVFGAMGLSPDTRLADHWTWGRALRFADGPDQVHLQTVARIEIRGQPGRCMARRRPI